MKSLIIMMLCCFSMKLKAQNWDEIFKQKKTQNEYLLKQIVAFKVYGNYLKKGYEIAKGGLKTLSDLKKGEFDLHQDFFNSLKSINPVVANNPEIATAFDLEKGISYSFKTLKLSGLSTSEIDYINTVKKKVLEESHQDLENLSVILKPSQLEMEDSQRIQRIDELHQNLVSKYQFTKTFVSEILLLQNQKEKEKQEIKWAERLLNPSN
ncbi:hypothetical protein N9R54_00375 [Pelobium sp.]|nr:hypothetical protein [Pelobium sp.]MDA9554663.1 hypothetical protein [Pelobium sp.]